MEPWKTWAEEAAASYPDNPYWAVYTKVRSEIGIGEGKGEEWKMISGADWIAHWNKTRQRTGGRLEMSVKVGDKVKVKGSSNKWTVVNIDAVGVFVTKGASSSRDDARIRNILGEVARVWYVALDNIVQSEPPKAVPGRWYSRDGNARSEMFPGYIGTEDGQVQSLCGNGLYSPVSFNPDQHKPL